MIVGLEDITEGDLYIGDDRMNDKAPRDRNLAMVFQNYALYPHLTVYENIAFPLRLRKASDEEVKQKVEDAADLLELKEHLHRKPANLSGGQRQRVAMGRALVRDAVGVPLRRAALQPRRQAARHQCAPRSRASRRRLGMTTVYVTHDQIEAMTLGDRVAVLRKGLLQQVASPRELYETPVNLFVAGFIGSPSMNFLPAWVEGQTLHLPIADVKITPEIADEISGHEVLIAGIRPEHFEVAAKVPEEQRARASRSAPTSTSSSGSAAGSSPTSPSTPRPRWPSPWPTWPRSSTPSRSARSWWWRSTRRARSRKARRPSCGSTPLACSCSTPVAGTT